MYVIDTCSLTALYRVYPRDVFNNVWEHLEGLIRNKIVISSIEVLYELEAVEDRLLEWAKMQNTNGFFIELDEEVQRNASKVLASHKNLLDFRKNKSSGDVFLISLAICKRYAIVTEEKHSGGPERSKIPDVCDYYAIKCVNLLQMLRETQFSS